jgi:hypothetical protein
MGAFPSSNYVPVQQTAYFLEGLFSEPKLAQMVAAGIFDVGELAAEVKKGDFVNIPKLVQFPDFGRVDITSTTAVTANANRISSNAGKVPVLRDYGMAQLTTHDALRIGQDIDPMLFKSAGNKMAKRLIKQMHNSLTGGVGCTGINHTKALGANPITVNAVRQSKKLLSDQYSELDTCLIHPDVWFDLVYDLQTNYKYMGVVSGQIIMDGGLEMLMGVKKFIVTADLAPTDGVTTASAGDDVYTTWFMGAQAVYLGFQRNVLFEEFDDIRVPSTLRYLKASMDYVVSAKGVAFSGSANPLDTDISNTGNWAKATEDVRNIKIVKLSSYGNVYA